MLSTTRNSCSCNEALALLVQVETAKKMINSLVEERSAVVTNRRNQQSSIAQMTSVTGASAGNDPPSTSTNHRFSDTIK